MQAYNQYPPQYPPPQGQQQYPPMGIPQYPPPQGQGYNMQQPQYPPPYQMPPPVYGQGYSSVPPPPPPPPANNGQFIKMPPVIINQPQTVIRGQVELDFTHNNNGYPSSADGVPYPASVRCPCCKANVTTIVEEEVGTGTWICCLITFCLIPPFCCIPFCVGNCKDKMHHCPKCQTPVGLYEYKVC